MRLILLMLAACPLLAMGCAGPNAAYVKANADNVAHVKAAHLPTVPASQREDWQDFYESWELLNREAGK